MYLCSINVWKCHLKTAPWTAVVVLIWNQPIYWKALEQKPLVFCFHLGPIWYEKAQRAQLSEAGTFSLPDAKSRPSTENTETERKITESRLCFYTCGKRRSRRKNRLKNNKSGDLWVVTVHGFVETSSPSWVITATTPSSKALCTAGVAPGGAARQPTPRRQTFLWT